MYHTQDNVQYNNQENTLSKKESSLPTKQITLSVQRLEHGQGLELPRYATAGSSGLDLRAALTDKFILAPGKRVLIPTGLIFHLLPGYEAQIRPRSGLALKHGITCLNTPGTIDSDYRGEVKVLLINLGQEEFSIERGMRIAQMVITEVMRVNICTIELDQQDTVQTPDNTEGRGAGGFGSTGHN
ncbi:dUTP diphosphatase [Bartonella sp. CB175]|uniref:dUTP diphosphatase n=1 Tax=Bartonella sp. CB175 TaxID=3112256 RepID=UPI00300DD8F9